MSPRKRLSTPKPCPPVTGKYFFDKDGNYKLENQDWLRYLAEFDETENKLVGKNPRLVSPEVLIKAGHPARSATQCIKTYLRDLKKDYNPDVDKGLKRVRELCLECAESAKEVRNCTIINCPLWCHRLGFNPHNFHRRFPGAKQED